MTSHRLQYPDGCCEESCTATHPGSKWDCMRADKEGWFHSKEGKIYCPEHKPAWVNSWRAKKQGRTL